MITQQKTKNLLCEHSETKKDLKILKGTLSFAYCSECKSKIFYKGKIYPIDETLKEYTFKCRRCGKELKVIRRDWDSWIENQLEKPLEDIWICDNVNCGAERMIILQTAKINNKIKVIEKNKLIPEELPKFNKSYCFTEEDLDKIYKMIRDYHSATFPFEIRNNAVFVYGIKDILVDKLGKSVIVDEKRKEWVIV